MIDNESRRFFEGLLLAVGLTLAVAAFVLLMVYWPKDQQTRKDCTLAEFSPDFTSAQREACRQLRNKRK